MVLTFLSRCLKLWWGFSKEKGGCLSGFAGEGVGWAFIGGML